MKQERTLIFVSDLRGNYDILLDYVQFSKFIKWGDEFEDKLGAVAAVSDSALLKVPEKRLEFRNECVVVFCGGVFNKGDEDVRVARAVVDFKQRYPDRVILLLSPADFQEVTGHNKEHSTMHNGDMNSSWALLRKYAENGQLIYRHGSVLVVQNSIFQQFFLQDSLSKVWENFLANVFQEQKSEMLSRNEATDLSSWIDYLNNVVYHEILLDLQSNEKSACLDGVKQGIDMGQVGEWICQKGGKIDQQILASFRAEGVDTLVGNPNACGPRFRNGDLAGDGPTIMTRGLCRVVFGCVGSQISRYTIGEIVFKPDGMLSVYGFFASKQGFAYMLGPPRHSSASWGCSDHDEFVGKVFKENNRKSEGKDDLKGWFVKAKLVSNDEVLETRSSLSLCHSGTRSSTLTPSSSHRSLMDLKLLKCASMRNLAAGVDLNLINHPEKSQRSGMEHCLLPRTPSLYWIQRSLAHEEDEEEDFGFWEFEYYTGLDLMQAVGGGPQRTQSGSWGWGTWSNRTFEHVQLNPESVEKRIRDAESAMSQTDEASLLPRAWQQARKFIESMPEEQDKEFLAMQFNMLAEGLSSGPSDQTPYPGKENGSWGGFSAVQNPDVVLNWEYRRWRLLEVILTSLPDLLGAQEIDRFPDFFYPILAQYGYTGLYCAKEKSPCIQFGHYSDGVAAFWKGDRFTCNWFERSQLQAGGPVLFVLLNERRDPEKDFLMVVTHLKSKSDETNLNDPLPPSAFDRTDTEYTTWKVRGTSQHRQNIDYIFMSDGFEPVARLLPPPDELMKAPFLPSPRYPSDHISIAAKMIYSSPKQSPHVNLS
ncbi:hypothetical protein GUITHDRAFT_113450 [Guillardia theta CCMP2712]|uniref:Endonuclease/exonuclease/phosphatase domain-containing protein n=1 Tax=Guillardia theta (strain CCMP2712) TaxID=905079 RepID=L1IW10_GUITC|nr:hypothetical protein GUITHDRAFT_113450 [Guillardia theta CCMP2712]EKX40421.1 hypothetical protein GUITHDRAFT_113450 [Guillardia theta CCMP2712]|eukprot:XP_005827401.1 hypothetical protein GUITHDRAFT_113450 [Guillardia theta CCMP2712]